MGGEHSELLAALRVLREPSGPNWPGVSTESSSRPARAWRRPLWMLIGSVSWDPRSAGGLPIRIRGEAATGTREGQRFL